MINAAKDVCIHRGHLDLKMSSNDYDSYQTYKHFENLQIIKVCFLSSVNFGRVYVIIIVC